MWGERVRMCVYGERWMREDEVFVGEDGGQCM